MLREALKKVKLESPLRDDFDFHRYKMCFLTAGVMLKTCLKTAFRNKLLKEEENRSLVKQMQPCMVDTRTQLT